MKNSILRRSILARATVVNPFVQPEQDAQLLITPEHGLFILLLSLILVVRLVNLNFNTLHLDEAIYSTVGEDILAGRFDQQATRWMFGSYLYPILSTLVSHAAGVVGLRAVSALSITVAAVLVYLTARRLFGPPSALWAMFLFGLSGVSIDLGQHAVLDAIGVPLLAAALYLVVSAMLQPEKHKTYLRWAGIVFSLCVLAKYIGLLALPGLLLVMLVVHLYQGRDLLTFITRVSWQSLLIPMVILLGIYGAYYSRDLQEVLTGRFAFQFESRWGILVQILQELDIPILFSLVAIPFVMQQAYDKLHSSQPGLLALFAVCIPGLWVAIDVLPIYHLVSSNARSLWKHEVYALVFIAPLAGYGIARLIDYVRSRFASNTFKLRVVGAVVTVGGMFWFVGGGIHENADFHSSWPDSQAVIDFLRSQNLTPQSKVLASSYAIYDYYFNFGVKGRQVWNNVWDAEYANLQGPDAVRRAIQDCAYELVILDDYYAPELTGVLEPLVQKAGYRMQYNASQTLASNTVIGTRVYKLLKGQPCQGAVQ